jgi:hypothetical protein
LTPRTGTMTGKKTYLLSFEENQAVWRLFDGQSLVACEPPGTKVREPVVALIPDSFFFFFLPKSGGGKREKGMREAAKLQMQYSFPAPADGREHGVFRGPAGGVLGYFGNSELKSFWETHREGLEQANVVTTPFLLAWTAAHLDGVQEWSWRPNQGPCGLFSRGTLHYFVGDTVEQQARESALEFEQEPVSLELEGVLASLVKRGVKWPKLGVPVQHVGSVEEGAPRKWVFIFLAISLVGLLVCFGEFWRWNTVSSQTTQWEEALDGQYTRVLGNDLGSDPFGMLLYKLEQFKGSKAQGLDVLALLEVMSRGAVEGFSVDTLNISNDTGTVRASIATYAQLEEMLKNLNVDPRFAFTLEEAVNVESGIDVTLKVELRG